MNNCYGKDDISSAQIEFALILAVYAGMKNASLDYPYDCDNSGWRERYLKKARETIFEYDDDGCVNSEWAYNVASDIVDTLFKEAESK